jgi:hypothetical protein
MVAPESTHRLAASLACLLVLAMGCSSVPGYASLRRVFGGGTTGNQFTAEDLRADLAAYAARFSATVIAAADQIASESSDPEIQRRALLWKVRIIPLVEQAGFVLDPEQAYVALFALATAQQQYLRDGAGKDLFGEEQSVAMDAADDLVGAARNIGTRFLNADQQARLEDQVQALAASRPIRGVFVPETVQAVVSAVAPGGAFDWVIHYPLAPFRALEGVDSGAQAIRDFTVTAQRFNQLLSTMPQHMRWNVELLAFELEQRPTVSSARASLETLAESSADFSRAVALLPENLRAQASLLMQELEARQGELQRTLAEARGLVSDTGGASQQLEPLAAALERTAAKVEEAGVAWGALLAEARKPSPESAGEPARPFDILDYERTATQISAAATELRGLLLEARGLDNEEASDGLVARLAATLDRVEGGGRSLVNLAAWRVLELMLVGFALLFGFRRIEAYLVARRTRGAKGD